MAYPVTTDKFWPFPKIADLAAQDQDGKHWRSTTDDYLGALAGDFWPNHFPQVFHSSFGIWGNEPRLITREVVWRMLGAARPLAFHDIQEGEDPDWEELAKAGPEDYGSELSPPGIRNTALAELLLLEAEARDWIRSQGKVKRPQGRPARYD